MQKHEIEHVNHTRNISWTLKPVVQARGKTFAETLFPPEGIFWMKNSAQATSKDCLVNYQIDNSKEFPTRIFFIRWAVETVFLSGGCYGMEDLNNVIVSYKTHYLFVVLLAIDLKIK